MNFRRNLLKVSILIYISFVAIAFVPFLQKQYSLPDKPILVQEDSLPIGNWEGNSICQVKNSACKDELVVYHISKKNETYLFRVNADKIVNGSSIPMGGFDFRYDPLNRTLTCETNYGIWKLNVNGRKMEGILTLSDKTLFRKITLKKME